MAKKGEADVSGQKESKESKDSKEPKKVEAAKAGFSPSVFLQSTKEELDKVVWPSRQQLVSESVAVILMVTLSATVIYLVDNFFGWASKQVF
ncbi:MAG: preprotein translocase subunit SecE [Cyanobacteria bacterium RM1_2_2]|nr:preprotein translocase subunit SecE [Cyanobacteria bacterium RM1_2_2]